MGVGDNFSNAPANRLPFWQALVILEMFL